MKWIYSRFRIALMAFVLGLAAVYMTNGLSIAWSEVPVDLPTAKSTDVFAVFPIAEKYTEFDNSPRSGGDGGAATVEDPSPMVTIEKVTSQRSDELRFRVANRGNHDIYMAYSLDYGDRNQGAIPYTMECPDKTGQLRSVGPEYDFGPGIKALAAHDHFVFDATRPKTRRPCVLSVGYQTNPHAVDLIKKGYSHWSAEDQVEIELGWRQLEVIF